MVTLLRRWAVNDLNYPPIQLVSDDRVVLGEKCGILLQSPEKAVQSSATQLEVNWQRRSVLLPRQAYLILFSIERNLLDKLVTDGSSLVMPSDSNSQNRRS